MVGHLAGSRHSRPGGSPTFLQVAKDSELNGDTTLSLLDLEEIFIPKMCWQKSKPFKQPFSVYSFNSDDDGRMCLSAKRRAPYHPQVTSRRKTFLPIKANFAKYSDF